MELTDRLQAALGETCRIERELGGGGMSRVFLATDTELGRRVVVKVLPPEMAAGVNVDRFRREIQLAAQLQHPHIVPLLTAGARDDLLYYIMPYIEGESLRTRMGRVGALPVPEALALLREIADALASAHAQGIVHRDIKPENVLLSGRHALVADFGVAKAMSASSGATSLTSLGMALGTPAYMAPEQAAGDPNIDHRADLYALGALGYEMLCGRPPFTGPTPQSVLAAQVTQTPEPCTAHRPTVPPALAALIMACLQKHPSDRPQTADEVLVQLEALALSSAGLTPAGSTPVATEPVVRARTISSGTAAAIRAGHPGRVAAMFLGAGALVLAVVYLLVQQLGLPDWVWIGAIVLLALGLPIMLLTGLVERRRALARTTAAAPDAGGWHGWFTWRRAVMGGVAAFAVLGLVAAGYTAMRLLGIGPVGTLVASGVLSERDPLLVADFENHTNDSTLGSTVTEALRIDLAQSAVVRLLDERAVSGALGRMNRPRDTPMTPTVASEMAEREGLKAIIVGQIDPIGTGYVLSARIVSPADNATLVAVRETAADGNALIGAVDRLSSHLRERIGESLRTIRANQPLAQVTTGSIDALRAYTEGLQLEKEGAYDRALEKLGEATTLDSTFAMAWRKQAVILSNTFASRERTVAAATRAYQYRDRLPEIERLHAIAFYYRIVEPDQEKSARAYQAVLERNPDDLVSLNNLALVYGSRRQYAAAESLYRRAATLDTTSRTFGGNLIETLVNEGKVDEADTVLDRYLAAPVTHELFLPWKGAMFALNGLPDSAHAVWEGLLAGDPDLAAQDFLNYEMYSLDRLHGKLDESARHGQTLMKVGRERGIKATPIFDLIDRSRKKLVYENDPEGAARLLDSDLRRFPLDSIPPADRPYLQLATLYAEAGPSERARELIEDYHRAVPESQRRAEWEEGIRGLLLLREGKAREAVPHLRYAADSSCGRCGWALRLSAAFEQIGEPDSAIAALRKAVTPDLFGHENDFDTRAAMYRRLGELYEGQGNRSAAVEYYTKFVDLWKDADPALQPQVREVKQRLGALVGEQPRS